jgi:hypothetical protein
MGKPKTRDLPQSVFSALRQDPASFVGEMRLAAAVKWYEWLKSWVNERWALNASPIIVLARGSGFRLDEDVIREALSRTVGETWDEHSLN